MTTTETPKKKHTVRNVLLIGGILTIGAFAGCTALVGGAVSEVDKAMQAEAANDKPVKVDEGAAFDHDIWSVSDGWKVKGGMLGAEIKNLRAEHTGDTADTPFLTFTLTSGKRVQASIDCHGPEAQPGETVRLQCVPDGKAKGYDTVKVRDTL